MDTLFANLFSLDSPLFGFLISPGLSFQLPSPPHLLNVAISLTSTLYTIGELFYALRLTLTFSYLAQNFSLIFSLLCLSELTLEVLPACPISRVQSWTNYLPNPHPKSILLPIFPDFVNVVTLPIHPPFFPFSHQVLFDATSLTLESVLHPFCSLHFFVCITFTGAEEPVIFFLKQIWLWPFLKIVQFFSLNLFRTKIGRFQIHFVNLRPPSLRSCRFIPVPPSSALLRIDHSFSCFYTFTSVIPSLSSLLSTRLKFAYEYLSRFCPAVSSLGNFPYHFSLSSILLS